MKWQRILIGVFGLGALAAALGFAWLHDGGPTELRLPGVVETQEVRLSSKIGGRIRRILVREGERVRAGQELVLLEAPELEARRAQLQASRDAAQARLDRAVNGALEEEKASARAAVASARAKLDRLRAGPRSEDIAAARADWEGLRFELERAARDRDRELRLQSGRAAAAVNVEAAHAAAGRLREQVRAAEARWKLLANGTRPEEIQEAEAELARARAQSDLLERGTRSEDVAAARANVGELYAQIQEIDAQLREAVVVAPDAALVETVALRRGDVASANQPLIRVLLAEDLWVKAYVSEPDLGKLRLNQEVKVTTDAYSGRALRGRIIHIASVSEFTPRNVQTADERRNQVFALKVRVLESAHVFRSGMAADVIIPLAPSPEQ